MIRPQLGFITFFFNSIQCQNIQIRSTKHCLFYQINYDELNFCLSCPLPSKEKECKKKELVFLIGWTHLHPPLDWIELRPVATAGLQLQLEFYLLSSDWGRVWFESFHNLAIWENQLSSFYLNFRCRPSKTQFLDNCRRGHLFLKKRDF